jgi:hypothetical protein
MMPQKIHGMQDVWNASMKTLEVITSKDLNI